MLINLVILADTSKLHALSQPIKFNVNCVHCEIDVIHLLYCLHEFLTNLLLLPLFLSVSIVCQVHLQSRPFQISILLHLLVTVISLVLLHLIFEIWIYHKGISITILWESTLQWKGKKLAKKEAKSQHKVCIFEFLFVQFN